MKNSTHLSILRILITATLFFAIPFMIPILSDFVTSPTIAATVIIHSVTVFLVISNFDILDLHFKRIRNQLQDVLLYAFFGFLLFFAAILLNHYLFLAPVLVPDLEIIKAYPFFSITIFLAYSFCWSTCFSIAFKAITDRFKVRIGEKIIILFSGILFGLLIAIAFSNFQWELLLRGFIYYFSISIITSYLYNQTHSIIIIIVSYGLAILVSLL